MRPKIHLSLTDEAATFLEVNATERRRGDLVSQIIMDYAKRNPGAIPQEDKEGAALAAISAGMRRIEAALGRIERRLS